MGSLIYMEEVKEYIVKMAMVDIPYFDSFSSIFSTRKICITVVNVFSIMDRLFRRDHFAFCQYFQTAR